MYRLLSIFLLSLVVPCLTAQETINNASLSGRVTDPTGAILRDTTVTARATVTNVESKTETDAAGRFRFPYLQVGQYQVTIHHDGFSDAGISLTLTIGADFNLPITLTAGATQAVTVNAVSPVLETSRSQIAATISQNEVANLPFEGRNYLDLSLLLPGVSPTNTASTQTLAETSEVVGQGYSINSQRNFSNSFVVDGLSDNDDAADVAGNVFSMDVVREFQVVTSGGQAEFGRALGGYFNIATKSGTNQLHGTAYGFLRNQRLNADNALSGSNLPITQGQYGASLSGPLQKDRTFLFGNFEEERLRTDGIITITPANAATINSKLKAVGYQAPLLTVGTGPTTLYPTTLHTDTAFLRADHSFSRNDQFSVRYSYYQLNSLNARGTGSLNAVSNGTSVFDTNHTVALSNIATLSPRTFNETRGQFIYDSLNAPPNDQIGPVVSISGVATFGRSTSSPTARLNYLGEVVDNLVMERGAHTFKVGTDFLYNDDTITFPQSLRGSYSFSSLSTFLNGTYNSQGYTQNFGTPIVQQNNPSIGFYAQDEWKVSQSFTLNIGVRYDLEFLHTINTDTDNVSPRIGFSWSPYANRGTVVRGSYGLFYDRIPLRPLANALLSAHNTIDPAQAALLSYTFSPGQAGAPTFPNVAIAPPAGAVENFSTMNPNIQNPYSQQASLEIEQQLSKTNTLGINYQHVRGEHLIGSINTNINLDGTRPDPTRGNIKPYSSAFDSYFDALEVSLQQRPLPWGSARLSYTYSKAIDNISEFFFSAPINNFNLREDQSRSDDDQRHRVVFDASLTSSIKPANGWVDHLTHGWRLGGVLQYYSRLPFNITTGANTKQATAQRPCASGFSLTANGGLNPCTEALPGAVIGRNSGTGFDFFSLNSRLSRTFSLTERVKLEGMAEAFNALNHRNDMIPNGTFGNGSYPNAPNSTFGQATAVGDPRSIQLGARLSF
ncbi:carboxypeptidase regulatory-like domain-containing protein [Granulicella sp. S156]|uniref:TonB-dependent receptor n=1 Tax=Granulicella sp. S156 TaxID=1747224 RepID=UPI00131A76EE|nr:carboxypeptidase regulatory-like domain-containing protein [Granulicella sp. S156]